MTTSEGEPPAPIVSPRTGLAIGLAVIVGNLSNYSFQIIAGRQLTVEQYGLLGGFLAVVTVITVSASSLQIVSARSLAAGEAVRSTRPLDGLTRAALKAAAVIALCVLVLSPLIGSLLRVGIVPVVLLGLYVTPACIDSIAAGRLQGLRRFAGLAVYSASQGVAKVVFSAAVLIAGAQVQGLLATVIISSTVIAVIGLRATSGAGAVETRLLSQEARRSFAAIALFWLILSIDVPIARANFDGVEAGIYAAASVLGKAVLWLPALVAQLVFPSLAQSSDSLDRTRYLMRRSAALVLAISTLSVGSLYLLGEPLFRFLYGDRYVAASDIAWKIGLAVVPLAFVNLVMYLLLAQQHVRYLRFFVAAVVAEVIALQVVPSTPGWYAVVLGAVGIGLLVPVVAIVLNASAPTVPADRGGADRGIGKVTE